MNSWFTFVLEKAPIYALWQAPFAADKVAPLLAHNELSQVRRVLDVGCGPGTNTHLFKDADYLGIDINPGYIRSAQRKYQKRFLVADVTTYGGNGEGRFDFVFINSFLHHVNDADVNRILEHATKWTTEDGNVHILELVSPRDRSIAQWLANWDRGKYPRPLQDWRSLFERHLNIAVFEPYALKVANMALWNMVYCKGRPRHAS